MFPAPTDNALAVVLVGLGVLAVMAAVLWPVLVVILLLTRTASLTHGAALALQRAGSDVRERWTRARTNQASYTA